MKTPNEVAAHWLYRIRDWARVDMEHYETDGSDPSLINELSAAIQAERDAFAAMEQELADHLTLSRQETQRQIQYIIVLEREKEEGLVRERELQAENHSLRSSLTQVDDVLMLDHLAAVNGDYRKALHDLVTFEIQIHDDPAVSKVAAARAARERELVKALALVIPLMTHGRYIERPHTPTSNAGKEHAQLKALIDAARPLLVSYMDAALEGQAQGEKAQSGYCVCHHPALSRSGCLHCRPDLFARTRDLCCETEEQFYARTGFKG